MSKYNYVELKIDKGNLTTIKDHEDILNFRSVIYIYKNLSSNKVYIGQTVHFIIRNKEHYSGQEEKFNNANFNRVIILFSFYFNGSALDDVESQLITYFIADNPRTRHPYVEYDNNLINLTNGNKSPYYRDKNIIDYEIIPPFWEKVLYRKHWVSTKSIKKLKAEALVKYSPIKILTEQQRQFIDEIVTNPNESYVINGDAGTGKTVLLTHLVASILRKKKACTVGVVVQPNWEKTAKEIFKVYGLSNDRLTIATSTKLINDGHHYDVIIIDEAHKLSRRFGKQHPSFNSVYKDKFANYTSHLEILKSLGKQIVLMYDVLQTIRPANITRDEFSKLTSKFKKRYLKTQFRIQAPEGKSYNSDDYINGIKYLLYKDTGLLKYTNFDPNFNRDVFNDPSSSAYFGYFKDKPLRNLFDWIETDRNYHPDHVNRVLSGLVEPWKQKDGKDINKKHFFEDELSYRWNSTQENWINSKDKDSEDQIGSVFAVQGIDLNKVGVLIGNDLQIDENGKLFANPDNFHNVNGKFSKDDLEITENKQEFTIFVLNIYYVLMTRGIDGIRLGFWKNDDFMSYMKKTLGIKN